MAEAMEVVEINDGDGNLCTECKQKAEEITRLKKRFCSDCWIYHCNYRFRKRLYDLGKPQKSSKIQADSVPAGSSSSQNTTPNSNWTDRFLVENVLIDYDGSSEYSMALLYLIRDTVISCLDNLSSEVERPRTLPFPFTFTILFISAGVHENGEIDLTKKENIRIKNFEKLKTWYKEIKASANIANYFPSIVVTSIEESLSITQNIDHNFNLLNISEQIDCNPSFPLNGILHEKLVSLVENLRTKTSRIDLLQILRHNLTNAVARRLNIAKILVTEDQSNLAVKMFSLMSLGRGAQLADQMNFVTRQEGALVARPMMDMSSDDLRDYLRCLNLMGKCNLEKPDTRRIDDIKTQCEDFIFKLQKDFSATVPTLTRIGAKLEPTCKHSTNNEDIQFQNKQICTLCKNIQDDVEDNIVGVSLCYGCTQILKEMKTPSLLLELLKEQLKL